MQAKATKEATSLLTTGLKAAEEEDEFGLIAQYNLHLVELNLQSNDLDHALHYANNALQITSVHDLWEQGDVYMTAAHVNERMKRIDEAEELIDQACEYFQNKKLLHKVAMAQDFRRQIRKT